MTAAKPLAGEVERLEPWSIKAISTTAKEAIIEAARKEKVNYGDWIAMAAFEKIDRDAGREVTPKVGGYDNLVAPTFSSSAEAVALAVQLAGVPKENHSQMLGTARQAVRNFLLAQRGASPAKSKKPQLSIASEA